MAKTELVERVQAVLEARGWSPYQWAKRAKLSSSTIANMISRRSKATEPETLRAMAEAAGVSLLWLEHDQGSMDASAEPPQAAPKGDTGALVPPGPVPADLAEAIGVALDPARGHTYGDGRAVEVALGDSFRFEHGVDAVRTVGAWLDAARNLRRRGVAVSTAAIMQELVVGRDIRRGPFALDDAASTHANDGAQPLALDAEPSAALPSDRPVEGSEGMASRTVGPDAQSGIHAPPSNAEELRAKLGVKGRRAK